MSIDEKRKSYKSYLLPHKMFFLDGIGACLSFFLLAAMLYLEPLRLWVGMPTTWLWVLMLGAALMAMLSMSCYLRKVEKVDKWLLRVIVGNLLYCALSLGVLIGQFEALTTLGKAYFMGEKLLIFSLVALEFRLFAASLR